VCKDSNSRSYFVTKIDDIENKWFAKHESVGISGATSTPLWLMEDIKLEIERI